jgi:hypothetical protein
VLRKYDCTNVQAVAARANSCKPARFSPCGERATLPFVSGRNLMRRILENTC